MMNTLQTLPTGLIIRQKEPTNLETPIRPCRVVSHSDRVVLHPQSFPGTEARASLVPIAH